jgi:hypothetical protein
MPESFVQCINGNERLVRRGRLVNASVLIETGDTAWLVIIAAGRIAAVTRGPFVMPACNFALRFSADGWQRYTSPVPQPGFNDLFALMKRRLLRVEGELHPFMANLFYFKEVLAAFGAAGRT